MNGQDQLSFDPRIATWLEGDPSEAPDQALQVVLAAFPSVTQRLGSGRPRRFSGMPTTFRLAVGAAAVIAAVLGGALILAPGSVPGVGAPAPSATPSAARSAAASQATLLSPALLDTTTWRPFTSPRFGFGLFYPPSFTSQPSVEAWTIPDEPRGGFDYFYGGPGTNNWLAASMPLPAGTTEDQWIEAYRDAMIASDPNKPATCFAARAEWKTVIIDFQGAELRTGCGTLDVIAFADRRVFNFGAYGTETNELGVPDDFRTLFMTWLTTIILDPASVAGPQAWATYRSTQYEFEIGHPASWTTQSADHDWSFDADGRDPASSAFESFVDPEGDVRVSAWSVPRAPAEGTMSEGVTVVESWRNVERWVKAYCERTGNTPCTGIHERAVPLCLEERDCHPGLLVPFKDDVQAFFTNGGEGASMTVVTVWRGPTDPSTAPYGGTRALLEAFLATMNVKPAEQASLEERRADAALFKATSP